MAFQANHALVTRFCIVHGPGRQIETVAGMKSDLLPTLGQAEGNFASYNKNHLTIDMIVGMYRSCRRLPVEINIVGAHNTESMI